MSIPSNSQLNLKFRVRPQRVAVLIRSTASKKQLSEVIAFASSIWGGRYCAIIPASRKDVDRVRRRLISVCPEVVVAVSLDDAFWEPTVRNACQPRAYTPFPKDWKSLIGPASPLGLIWSFAVVNQVAVQVANATSTKIRLPPERRSSTYKILYDAIFGMPDNEAMPWIRETLKAEQVTVEERHPFSIFTKTCTELGTHFTWLDLAAKNLDRQTYGSDGLGSPPTIVILENTVADLVLFWSLRMSRGRGASRILLPIPRREIRHRESIDALVDWIKNTGISSNYCNVTSDTAPSPAAHELAAILKRRLRGTSYRFVDVVPESEIWPTMVPFEVRDDYIVSATLSDGVLSCELPKPSLDDSVRNSDVWMVDLITDLKTNRSLGEIAIPRSNTFTEVLQAATPPKVSIGGLPVAGLTLDSVSFRCSKRNRQLRYQLPTANEFLHAHLRKCGMKLVQDEKERRYRAAMKLCGGLRKTCHILLGKSMAILEILENATQPIGKITSKLDNVADCQKNQKSQASRMNSLYSKMSETASQVSRQRFNEHVEEGIRSGDSVKQVLPKLIQRRIIEPRARIGRCDLCQDDSWLGGLDLTNRVLCPGCGVQRFLLQKLEVGYSLNPLISVALKEGIRTVMLTARFLLNATSRGFHWLPGCKGKISNDAFDFDIIAICDGRLVVAECKTLNSNITQRDTWDDIAEQFERTIEAGNVCHADLAVFACQADRIPKTFIRRISASVHNRMQVLFLTGRELEGAHREIEHPRGGTRWATIDDFTCTDGQRRRRKRIARTIDVGGGRISR